jgi:arginine/serine-rich splicing factor 17
MSIIQSCHDTKDILDLFKPQDLYLKPIARLNVSVQLPQLKKSGAKISNWEVMERVKEMAKPLTFPVFKVAKSSLEFIRFEAEIENYGSMDTALAKLDMKTIKLSGFEELLKIRAAEAKPPFPTRHDWDTYFRENKIMNEMKAGERPDTIHLLNLPNKWFVNPQDRSGASKEKPSDYVLKKVFQIYGEIRAVDIPILDPYRLVSLFL